MSIQPNQLRLLITEVLENINYFSPPAAELLMLTAAQESHCGRYIQQINGPAMGIFQMEPETALDIEINFLHYRPGLMSIVNQYKGGQPTQIAAIGNIPYQIVMARMHYLRSKENIPGVVFPNGLGGRPYDESILRMAEYYKRVWNTDKGKATVEEAVLNYRKYVLGGGN